MDSTPTQLPTGSLLLPDPLLALLFQAMGAFDNVSLGHTLGFGLDHSPVVGWICFGFRLQALLIAAPIAGLILLDLVAYVLMRTLHISARRVRVRAAPSPPVPALVPLPPSPVLPAAKAAAPAAEMIPLASISDPSLPLSPTASIAQVSLGAPVGPAHVDDSPPTLVNLSPPSLDSASPEWTQVSPPTLVSSYGSAFSGISSTSSSSSVSSFETSASEAMVGGLGLSGTGSRTVSSVELYTSQGSKPATTRHRRGMSSLALSPLPSCSPEDGDPNLTPTSTPASATSSPPGSRMTTPGLRHRALPPLYPLSGPSQTPNMVSSASPASESESSPHMNARPKHSRARAASVGVEGALGLEEEEEDAGEESDDEASSSGVDAGRPLGLDQDTTLRRRTTIRA